MRAFGLPGIPLAWSSPLAVATAVHQRTSTSTSVSAEFDVPPDCNGASLGETPPVPGSLRVARLFRRLGRVERGVEGNAVRSEQQITLLDDLPLGEVTDLNNQLTRAQTRQVNRVETRPCRRPLDDPFGKRF